MKELQEPGRRPESLQRVFELRLELRLGRAHASAVGAVVVAVARRKRPRVQLPVRGFSLMPAANEAGEAEVRMQQLPRPGADLLGWERRACTRSNMSGRTIGSKSPPTATFHFETTTRPARIGLRSRFRAVCGKALCPPSCAGPRRVIHSRAWLLSMRRAASASKTSRMTSARPSSTTSSPPRGPQSCISERRLGRSNAPGQVPRAYPSACARP